jgi:hypothetical protein
MSEREAVHEASRRRQWTAAFGLVALTTVCCLTLTYGIATYTVSVFTYETTETTHEFVIITLDRAPPNPSGVIDAAETPPQVQAVLGGSWHEREVSILYEGDPPTDARSIALLDASFIDDSGTYYAVFGEEQTFTAQSETYGLFMGVLAGVVALVVSLGAILRSVKIATGDS